MEQTFKDLWHEKRQTRRGFLSFLLWTFLETITGIIQEHLFAMTQGEPMKHVLTNLRTPALLSLLLVLPLMLMELVNRRQFDEDFPIILFAVMWLLPVIFIVILMPIVRTIRAGNSILANPISLFLRVAFLSLIAVVWVNALIDQMPCFLGVPLCD